MKLFSRITVAIKRGDRYLIIPKNEEKVMWGFPHEIFEEALNGNLNDTLKRILENVVTDVRQSTNKLDYLGAIIKKDEDSIFIDYSFLLDGLGVSIKAKNFKWVERNELRTFELDSNTSTFLKVNKDFL